MKTDFLPPEAEYWAQWLIAAAVSIGSMALAGLLLRRFFPRAARFTLLDCVALAAAVASGLMTGTAVWMACAAFEAEIRVVATLALAPTGFYGMLLISQRIMILPWIALVISATFAASSYSAVFDRMASGKIDREISDDNRAADQERTQRRYDSAIAAERQMFDLVTEARAALLAAEASRAAADRRWTEIGGDAPPEQIIASMSARITLMRDQLLEAQAQLTCELRGPVGCLGRDWRAVTVVGSGVNSEHLEDTLIPGIEHKIRTEESEVARFRADTGAVRASVAEMRQAAADLVTQRNALLTQSLDALDGAKVDVRTVDAELSRLARPASTLAHERQFRALLNVTRLDADAFKLGGSWVLAVFLDLLSFQFLRHSRPTRTPWRGLKQYLGLPAIGRLWHGGVGADVAALRREIDREKRAASPDTAAAPERSPAEIAAGIPDDVRAAVISVEQTRRNRKRWAVKRKADSDGTIVEMNRAQRRAYEREHRGKQA